MIARSSPIIQPASWQAELRAGYARAADLLADLGLPANGESLADAGFPMRVPRPFARRMAHGDARDPLLLQVLPDIAESAGAPGYSADPVGDLAASRVPGLLQKYRGRALLILTGGCAVNCRYCFRREFPYQEAVGHARLESALAAITRDESVSEVILSGGDPLLLPDTQLATLAARIAAISHVRRLRVHTRLPVMIPSRVTDELLAWLTGTRLAPIVVLHINHPQEIDGELTAALRRLHDARVPLLNQAVLLRQVNDDAATLAALSERLFEAGALPYYVHLLDRVQGAAHFEVPEARARQIAARLRELLPGYLVPRFVREVAGAPTKLPFV